MGTGSNSWYLYLDYGVVVMTCFNGSGQVVDCSIWQAGQQARAAANSQQGSEFWLNSGYSGTEPPAAVKKAFTSATYASAWIGQYAQNLQAAGVPLSPHAAQIAAYPNLSPGSTSVWASFPGTAPTVVSAGSTPLAALPASSYPTTVIGATPAPTSSAGDTTQTSNPLVSGGGTSGLDLSSLSAWLPWLALGALAVIALPALLGGGQRGSRN